MSAPEFVAALPPRADKGGGVRQEFVEALKMRPGEWAVFPTKTPGQALAAASDLRARFPGVEAAVRAGVAYVRWVGVTP